jgi:hypothetical protein
MSDQSAIRFIYITYIYIYITFLFSYLNRYNCAGYWVLTSYFMNNIKTDYGLWIYTTYVILIRGELYSDIFLYEKNDQVIMTPCNEIKDYLSFGVHKSSLATFYCSVCTKPVKWAVRSSLCVLLKSIFLLYFGTVPKVWCFF